MPNPEYQRLLRCSADELRDRLPGAEPDAEPVRALLADVGDDALRAAFRNLGGHDHAALAGAFAAIDDTRPTVIFAYTVKGYGLAIEGHPQNHSALLTEAQLGELAARTGADPAHPWLRFPDGSAEAALCAASRRTGAA